MQLVLNSILVLLVGAWRLCQIHVQGRRGQTLEPARWEARSVSLSHSLCRKPLAHHPDLKLGLPKSRAHVSVPPLHPPPSPL